MKEKKNTRYVNFVRIDGVNYSQPFLVMKNLFLLYLLHSSRLTNNVSSKHTNLQILRVVFPVRVPRWKFFSKHDRQVIYETETRQKWVNMWSILN